MKYFVLSISSTSFDSLCPGNSFRTRSPATTGILLTYFDSLRPGKPFRTMDSATVLAIAKKFRFPSIGKALSGDDIMIDMLLYGSVFRFPSPGKALSDSCRSCANQAWRNYVSIPFDRESPFGRCELGNIDPQHTGVSIPFAREIPCRQKRKPMQHICRGLHFDSLCPGNSFRTNSVGNYAHNHVSFHSLPLGNSFRTGDVRGCPNYWLLVSIPFAREIPSGLNNIVNGKTWGHVFRFPLPGKFLEDKKQVGKDAEVLRCVSIPFAREIP